MNRRDLFRGAGALALSAAMPAPTELPMSPAERYRQLLALRAQWEDRVVGRVVDRFWEGVWKGDPDAELRQFEGLLPRYDVQPLPVEDPSSIWVTVWDFEGREL